MDKVFDKVDKVYDNVFKWAKFVIPLLAVAIIIAAWFVSDRDGLAYLQTSDGKTVEITADDALSGTEFKKSHVYVDSGEGIVIVSDLEQGSIRMYVASGFREAFDDEITGKQTIELDVAPGDWTIGTQPEDGTTGTMTVSVR